MANSSILESARETIEGKNLKIVFPEGNDKRILEAAIKHNEEGLLHPIILGDKGEIQKVANENNLKLGKLEIIDPNYDENFDKLADLFVEARKGKATRVDADYMLKKDHNYYGVMMVKAGIADGMVSGAVGTTGDTIRPALQLIKTKPGVSRVSGVMVMIGPNGEQLVFADTAVNITLESQEMAEVAVESAETARGFGMDPRVALLSFSTKGSARHDLVDKVSKATKKAHELNPDLPLDGELQFDAAIDPATAKNKAPKSDVAGTANVFIFPDLQAGNIGYKIAQRLGGYKALGPILQGLNAPVNDLSRGCSTQDVYEIAIITASQSVDSSIS
ncbi:MULTISPECIES: phosphate acetyltransferase [Anaerococcus]|uniref:Phosphate acetyltransferase n=1 Tax=Anaerococcus octavius TaxID=54007 RepID=A0A2I1MBQ2_9FIRM|nr:MULTISPECIES: phosphate acetyltransferase [Anaerococcus]MBS6105213.1 phosphate acetyltransferase [Anaerococcus sp.]MDU0895043.1 phosphate acetyltransferase [Anaerococcus sp.]MDU2598660.1 phosphate acetyltransferase [Anaerococcus sp.]MDU3176743.1 phosphate acetyltransferase [Anaerococcus sp.]MDU4025827.1 phosphate acetyltransferase [Anaerococcus sp.]